VMAKAEAGGKAEFSDLLRGLIIKVR